MDNKEVESFEGNKEMSRVIPFAYSVQVWRLVDVVDQNIFVVLENSLGDKKFGSKMFHAAWGIDRKDTCPDYDNSQISALQELLLKA